VAGPILAATATFATTSVIAMLAIALLPTAFFGWAATVIESSSMQPTVVRGDIVILRPPDRRAVVGEVVRFPADDGGTAIVHRVVAIDEEAGAYVTRGDANESDDRALVPFTDVDGHGAMLVPLVGHPSLWVREGRYLTLGLFALGGLGVIAAGNSIGRRHAGGGADPSVDSDLGPIVPDTPLGSWAAGSSDPGPFAVIAALADRDHPGRDRPGYP
jgi:signal peptidase I